MKKESTVQELDLLHKQLLFSVLLPDAVLDPAAPAHVKNIDLAFARELLGAEQPWGGEDAFQESSLMLKEVFGASPEVRQLYLASEIDLLRKIKETGKDQVHRGPFDIMEGVFPILLRGHVVHLVRTGKYREAAFTAPDIKELSFLAGVPAKKVEAAAAALPIYDAERAAQVMADSKRLRVALTAALEQHLRATESASQSRGSERLQALGTMAQGMAHHMNNLLSIILGYTSLVSDKAKLDQDMAEALKKVADAAQRGRRFTEEILSSAGGVDDEVVSTSAHERIHGALVLMQDRIGSKIVMDLNLKAKRDVVSGPPGAVHEMIFSMLSNALDGLPNGGTISVSTSNGRDDTDGRDLLHIEVAEKTGESARKPAAKSAGGSEKSRRS